MNNWAEWFYGVEATQSLEEMERREEMYQAFKGRLAEEFSDSVKEFIEGQQNETSS